MSKKRVYFDTNAILDMSQTRCGISPSRVGCLYRLISRGVLSVVASMYTVEELLGPLEREHSPSALARVQRDLRFLLSVVGPRGFVKEPRDILDSDIRRCLDGGGPQDHFIPEEDIWEGLQWTLDTDDANDADVVSALVQTRAQIKEFRDLWNGIQADLLRRRDQQAPLPRDEEWQAAVRYLAKDWAGRRARRGISECEVERLLSVKSVRLAVGHVASFACELLFIEGRCVKESDCRDTMHVISASVADVFVTGDARLARLLDGVPDRGIEVLTLPSFLARLGEDICQRD